MTSWAQLVNFGRIEMTAAKVAAHDLLRYWLLSLRLEESLKVRPRARKQAGGSAQPRVDLPSAGQPYFKLPALDVASLTLDDAEVERAFDPELARYFEGWLLAQYRRGADEGELAHVLCFPVLHLPRGELAGLLRCGVKLRFAGQGAAFRVPTRAERKRMDLPQPPDRARLRCAARSDESWPFFLDTRLMSYPLGVSSERIDALFEAMRARGTLRPTEMLELVTRTLEDTLGELGQPLAPSQEPPLPRLLTAVQQLLRRSPMRSEAYPVGIVVDGSEARTTWYLQRELAALAADDDPPEGPLAAYLGAAPSPAGELPQRALFTGPALTKHQRMAAERAWGSALAAVQGPPGTGKTTLILHMCAESIAKNVDRLLDGQAMGAALLLITSGNNRAVDNVLDPLITARALPLALRVGSRQVCEQQLLPQLRGTLSWLAQARAEPAAMRTRAFAGALAAYAECRQEHARRLAPFREASERNQERARLELQLAALPEASASAGDPERAQAVLAPLRKVVRRIHALSTLCAKKPSLAHVDAVARHYDKTAARDLPPLEQALREAGITLAVPLPPLAAPLDVEALMEAWEDAAEAFLGELSTLQRELARVEQRARTAGQRRVLAAQRGALGPLEIVTAPEPDEQAARQLFVLAVEAREAWARQHAEALHEAVEQAVRTVEQERSLRPLFRDQPTEAHSLCQLFGVWGSTLLSLGNCLPAEPGTVAHAIVDEAGQCHPAHAVSALMRAERALLIGDVHQLAPVIELHRDDDARLLRGMRPRVDAEALAPYRVHAQSEVSAQSVASRAHPEQLSLIDHFRCQPAIIAVSDALCRYGLHAHPRAPDDASRASLLREPLSLCDLRGEQARFAGSLHNELELRETLQLVERLLARGVAPRDLAVITPYRGQLDRLRRGLVERRVPLEPGPEHDDSDLLSVRAAFGLALGTVHRFQGGERSIVLFSSVVSEPRSLGFLNDRPNLLNVAVSRAQQHFVCLGHREVLLQGRLTRVLVQAAAALTL